MLACEDHYYVAVRGWDEPSLRSRILNRITQTTVQHRPSYLIHRVGHYLTDPITSITLLRINSGVVQAVKTLVGRDEHGHDRNQNPFLFRLPTAGSVGLMYYSGDEDTAELRVKLAEDALSLDEAESHVLLRTSETIAAPSCCIDPVSNDVIVFAELERDDNWKTIYYRTESFPTTLTASDHQVLFSDDIACPFPFLVDETLYLAVARRLVDGLVDQWVGEIHKYTI
jgi:hypothetical protein